MTADDYQAIHNLIYRYCDRLDRGDLQGMSQLFAKCDFYVPGESAAIRNDPPRIAAMYGAYTRIYPDTGTPRTRHVTTNVIVEPDGPDAARAQSYVVVFQDAPGLSLQPVIAGRNYDRFVKDAGTWRFSERRIESDLFGDLSKHLLQAFPGH